MLRLNQLRPCNLMDLFMRSLLQKLVRSSFDLPRTAIHKNKFLHSLFYDADNLHQFRNLEIHERMLADYIRLDAYVRGIHSAVKPGDVVVDLGCGTGILSMFAAQRNPRKVYALDHTDIIDLAKRVAQHNKIDCIDFVKVNSRAFSLEEKADVIIHEQMGSFLLDENMLENLLDLKARVLKPGGRIVPAKFELYLEPVCLKRDHRLPFLWENNISGVDYSFLKDDEAYRRADRDGRIGGAVHKEPRLETAALEYYLCKPEPIFRFDLDLIGSEKQVPNSLVVQRKVTRSGFVDGISIYFRAAFDDDVEFDTALNSPRTNWRPPLLRIPRTALKEGDEIRINFDMPSFHDVPSWSIFMEKL